MRSRSAINHLPKRYVPTLNSHKSLAVNLLESLGFLIKYKKSNLHPTHPTSFPKNVSKFINYGIHSTTAKIDSNLKEVSSPFEHTQTNYPTPLSSSRALSIQSSRSANSPTSLLSAASLANKRPLKPVRLRLSCITNTSGKKDLL